MTGPESETTFRHRLAGGILGSLTIAALVLALAWPRWGSAPTALPAAQASITSSSTAATLPTSVTTTDTTTTPATNSTTLDTTTPDTITGATTSPTTTLAPLVMSAAGLGVVSLGDPYEDTVRAVTDRLGRPDHDSGWVRSDSEFGTCPGTVVRVVQWHSLRLFFSDGPTEFGEDTRHFFYYNQSIVDTDQQVDLATNQGIRLGSTVRELRRVYGEILTIDDSVSFGITFSVDRGGPSLLSGTLTSASPEGVVTSIGGGFGCGG